VIFINQIRMKIGVMFGNPETTTGGNALKFYSSVRLDIRRIGAIKKGDNVIGNRTRVKVVKNKMAPPFRECEFDILFNEGISRSGDLIDLGVNAQLVEKSGSWFSFEDERIGQGREAACEFLLAHPDAREKLEAKLRAQAGLPPKPAAAPASSIAEAVESVGAKPEKPRPEPAEHEERKSRKKEARN
jgi:recombination protein RecA